MIEERLGRDILVGTRAGGVGTGGHSAGAGVGKSLSRHNKVQAASRRPGAQRHVRVWRGGTNVPGMPLVGGSKRLLDNRCVPDAF
jgi:hypothetical protein